MVCTHAAGLSRCGIALWMLCGLVAPVLGAGLSPSVDARVGQSPFGAINNLLDFDIPAQSLASALNKYADMSHRSVMFRDALVSGRTSSPVQGRYTLQTALRMLLAGTGLVVEGDGDQDLMDAFVLTLAPRSDSVGAIEPDRHYDGLVQTRVWEAFCADPRTAPGSYRSVLRFQVDALGHVRQAHLLVPTGDGQRDAAMLAILAALQINRPPPQDLEQPLTLVILPHQAIAGYLDCRTVH